MPLPGQDTWGGFGQPFPGAPMGLPNPNVGPASPPFTLGGFGPLAGSFGLGIGSSLLGSVLGNRSFSPMEQSILSGNLQAANTGLGAGQTAIGMGLPAMRQALGYYSPIVSGNRAAMTSVLSPELAQISNAYGQAQQTSGALSPRGGPSAAFQSNLPWQQAGAVSNLFQGVRPGAAQNLMGAGNQLLGQGVNALYGSTAAGRNILEAEQNLRNLSAQQGRAIGGGLFGQAMQYGMPALAKQWPNIFGGMGQGTGSQQNPFNIGGGGSSGSGGPFGTWG